MSGWADSNLTDSISTIRREDNVGMGRLELPAS